MKTYINQDHNYLFDMAKGFNSSEVLLSVDSICNETVYEKLKKVLSQKHEHIQEIFKLKFELEEAKSYLEKLEEKMKYPTDLPNQHRRNTYNEEQQSI